ncbi:hypothetical protein IQ02_00300 [Flavobacterium glaciei]|uniref:Uncharacterized protein n=1 Tax=Flavobacterium glaciei TaxID=386300 RepID=A0A562Q5Y2_9FLAO|nr:hypothetical protein DFR66_101304 [Flavobacterium glaciei]TWI52161.1 hypothetical protein IQ02_00300 [Flavobacterium glaciei]
MKFFEMKSAFPQDNSKNNNNFVQNTLEIVVMFFELNVKYN